MSLEETIIFYLNLFRPPVIYHDDPPKSKPSILKRPSMGVSRIQAGTLEEDFDDQEIMTQRVKNMQ